MNPSSGGPGNDGSVNASQALANSVQEDESSDDDILHTLLGKRQREQTCDFRSLATPPSGAHTTVMNTTFGPNDCSESLQTNTLSLATGIRTDAMIQNPQHKRRHQMSLNPAEHAGYLQNTFDGTGPAGMLTNTLAAQPTGNYLPALPSIPLNEGKYLQFYEENHGTMQQGQHNQFFTSNLNMSPDIPVVDVASTFLLSNVQANNSHTRNFNMTGMQQQQQGRGECLGNFNMTGMHQQQQGRGECLGNFNMTGMHQQQQGRGESLGFRFPGAQVPNIMDPASGQIAFSNMSSLLQQPLLQIPQQANTSSVGPSSSMTQSSQHPQTYSSNYLLAAHAIHSRPSRVSNGTSKLEKNSNTQEIQAQTLTEAQSNLMPHGYYSSSLSLPPVNEGQIAHFSDREHVPLGIDEDENWLSEFQVRPFLPSFASIMCNLTSDSFISWFSVRRVSLLREKRAC